MFGESVQKIRETIMDWMLLPAAVLEPTTWILIPAALGVGFLVLTLLFRVLRAAIGTAIMLMLVLFALQFLFGITPDDLWAELVTLGRTLARSIDLS